MGLKSIFNMLLVGIIIGAFTVTITGCATIRPTAQEIAKESALTPGMAKKYIYPGKTSQTEVLEIFGPPDLVTHKGGKDVWTYDKISQEVSASGGYLTILLAGVSGAKERQAGRSVMLIIYFDENNIVEDYKLSAAKF
jgi:outer membrane protein assembly factor BamE (lipoprotein component of BamABCDE complex)